MTALHIAIVGYGTAGQAAAALLTRDGHRVEVFERVSRPGPVGAGFLLQPTGLQVLWEMGLLDGALAHGARIERLYGETPRGRAVMDMRYAGLDSRLFGLGLQRPTLFRLLADAWENDGNMHCGTAIVAVDDATRRMRDDSGRWHGPYDLIVVADGSASQLRGQVGELRLDRPFPWGALWCLLPSEDWSWPAELRQRYVAARKMIGMLPVGTRPDDATPRLSFFWSLPVTDFEPWRSRGLPAWREEISRIWPEAHRCLEHVTDAAQLSRASYRDAALKRLHRGNMVLIGDAAHAMSPQLGQGVNMALVDALALRDALREESGVEAALRRYGRVRSRHVFIYHFWSRWLTPLFQSDRDLVASARDLAFRPLGALPGGRGHMLRVLSGTQQGLFRKWPLQPAFLARLEALSADRRTATRIARESLPAA